MFRYKAAREHQVRRKHPRKFRLKLERGAASQAWANMRLPGTELGNFERISWVIKGSVNLSREPNNGAAQDGEVVEELSLGESREGVCIKDSKVVVANGHPKNLIIG